MEDITIAIPSYNRVKMLKTKTLATLTKLSVPMEQITIFVANVDQLALYKEEIDDISIIVAEPTMCGVRNFMTQYYEPNTKILYLDDDLDGFNRKDGNNKMEITIDEFKEMVISGFDLCNINGTKLFGIYPISNGLFMSNGYTTNLKYIVGCCYGVINDKDIKVSINDGEDYERTILFFEKYGAVIRLNSYAPRTTYWRKSGGMIDQRDVLSLQSLVKRWPQYCRLKIRKTDGRQNLAIKEYSRV